MGMSLLCSRSGFRWPRPGTLILLGASTSAFGRQSRQPSTSTLPRILVAGNGDFRMKRLAPSGSSVSVIQARLHGDHAHSHHHHHHHHDKAYLTSSDKNDPGVRITRIGLLTNLGMAIGKGIGGYVFHSQALVADAYHALTDLVSDFMTLATVSLALKPPSEQFPNGYGKVESLGAVGVSGFLLIGGLMMGLNASEVLLTQFFPDMAESLQYWGLLGHSHSHSHNHTHIIGPSINAAWLAGGSIVVKEYLYRATMKVSMHRKSSVLASNAVHHRIDSLTSIVALLTIGGAHVLPDASWLDPVGGFIISLMVVRAGFGNTKSSLYELADAAVDPGMSNSVRKAAMRAIDILPASDQIEIRGIHGIKSGQNYLMEMDIAVPGSWSVDRTRHIEQRVRERVGARVRGVKRLKIRFIPNTVHDVDFVEEFISPEVGSHSNPEPESLNSTEPVNDTKDSQRENQSVWKRK